MAVDGIVRLTPREEIRLSLTQARDALGPAPVPVEISIPPDPTLGEYASNLPLRMSRALRRPPLEIAKRLAETFTSPGIAAAPSPPGFVNFRLSSDRLLDPAREAYRRERNYLTAALGAGRRLHIEFVSANPTGRLHVGHARGAVLGDALARIFERAGFSVEREYYVNDTGHQIDVLGESLAAEAIRAWGGDPPPLAEAYRGVAVREAGRALSEEEGRNFPDLPPEERNRRAAAFGMRRFLEEIRSDLAAIGISFDRWVFETQLHASGQVTEVARALRERDLLYEAEAPEGAPALRVRRGESRAARTQERQVGGTFFRSSRFGDDEDRILLRKDGSPTYYTADIAYHAEKFARRHAERFIDIWGQDHASHAGRLRAALAALDHPVERLEILLVQIVRFLSGGVEVRMSKRTGEAVTLRELVEEVGPDSIRFFFLLSSPDAQCDFDIDLAKRRAKENPVFYCQYAHARLGAILARGEEMGLRPDPEAAGVLGAPEREVLVEIMRLRDVLEDAAEARAPHLLAQAALRFAGAWHRYQTEGKGDSQVRILRPEEARISTGRLFLVRAARAALGGALETLGISTPEVM